MVLLKEKNKSLRCDLTRAPQAVAPLFGDSGAAEPRTPGRGDIRTLALSCPRAEPAPDPHVGLVSGSHPLASGSGRKCSAQGRGPEAISRNGSPAVPWPSTQNLSWRLNKTLCQASHIPGLPVLKKGAVVPGSRVSAQWLWMVLAVAPWLGEASRGETTSSHLLLCPHCEMES